MFTNFNILKERPDLSSEESIKILEEKIFLYNSTLIDEKKSIDQACKDFGLCPSHVNSQECSLPLGFLAYGNEERKEEYLKEDSLKTNLINRPMMLIAGFTNQRLKEFLSYLKEKEIPYIAFKAVLTEYNAEWDSIELFSELEKDEAYFKNTKKTEE